MRTNQRPETSPERGQCRSFLISLRVRGVVEPLPLLRVNSLRPIHSFKFPVIYSPRTGNKGGQDAINWMEMEMVLLQSPR